MRIAQGRAISASEKPRQIAPSKATISHRTGLITLIDCIQPGMKASGIIPPPSIDIGIMSAQPAPADPCSVEPSDATSIIRPTNAIGATSITSRSSTTDDGRTPKNAAPMIASAVSTIRIAR